MEHVSWLVGDITKTRLAPNAYDVWYDRASWQQAGEIGPRTVHKLLGFNVADSLSMRRSIARRLHKSRSPAF